MNFLDLVTAVYEEAGISGTPPADVTSVSGEAKRIVRWVKEAYRQIQLQSLKWKWMRGTATVNTVAGDRDYAVAEFSGATRHRAWITSSARIYKTSQDSETTLFYLSYEDWLAAYNIGSQVQGRPVHYTIGPNNVILLGPTPDDVYTVTIDFYKSVHELASNTDVPELPADYHYAIVYRTLMKYARFESAPEIYDDARDEYLAEMRRLSVEFLEPLEWHTEALVE